jgi:gamma-glutamylcyclotransferase (GGCT)/AIG2-like uncharacterized protein YtfP
MKSELRIFAYGTLKKGFRNHDRYCAGVLRVCPAWLRGRLFKLSAEIPVMTIPEEDILLRGTASPAIDIQARKRFEPASGGKGAEGPASSDGAAWRTVRGELLVFGDAEKRLPLLDSLEGFCPGGRSEYIRVLVHVNLAGGTQTSAWTYIAGFDPAGLEDYTGESWAHLPFFRA